MAQTTTIRVETTTRDALQKLMTASGAASVDEAVRSLLWEHDFNASLARLEADPELAADYAAESDALGNTGLEIIE